ncbi:MAG: PEP-CTERM sorting domain-containing protein [Gammaproteobacteria bacterium]|nr:MAG: PEP-CTERM sorting domain-containing protein [Gammaproteobacteria bacterium]
MRRSFAISFLSLLLLVSLNANAFLISDTYVVEQQFPKNSSVGTVFELIPLGYSPETDSITHIKLTYDFTEIYSDTNQGDEEQYDEGNYPGEGSPSYEDEFVIFSSWMFIWREVFPDVDAGLITFEKDWVRDDSCQYMANAAPGEDDAQECAFNIDVAGTMNAYALLLTNNLLLHSITLEVDVDRVEIPEPHPLLLLGVGLFAIGFLRGRKPTNT